MATHLPQSSTHHHQVDNYQPLPSICLSAIPPFVAVMHCDVLTLLFYPSIPFLCFLFLPPSDEDDYPDDDDEDYPDFNHNNQGEQTLASPDTRHQLVVTQYHPADTN